MFSPSTKSLISAITSARNTGFTARISTSACFAVSLLSVPAVIPYFPQTLSAVSFVLAEPTISSARKPPVPSIPPIIASAIFPSPIKPIFIRLCPLIFLDIF